MSNASRPPVRLNDFRRQWQAIGDDAQQAFERVGESGWYCLGQEVEHFEHELAQFWGQPHAIGVGTGLDAIEIALRCLGAGPDDFVLTTPLSAFATTLAILRIGATPVFVDVDNRGLIDLDLCREALEARRDIRFFVPVHLYGQSLRLDALMALRDDFDLLLVEDCAQSIGARVDGNKRPNGTVGQLAATSFYPTKNLGALGDGGAILTADDALADSARALRDYGQTAKYEHSRVGLNSRLDEVHAAILRDAMLPRLRDWTAARRRVAARYLAGIDHPGIELPRAADGSVWHLFPVLTNHRDSLAAHLAEHGVGSAVHYPKLIPDQTAMAEYGRFEILGNLARSRRFATGELSLPIHPFLDDDEIERVIQACNQWRGT